MSTVALIGHKNKKDFAYTVKVNVYGEDGIDMQRLFSWVVKTISEDNKYEIEQEPIRSFNNPKYFFYNKKQNYYLMIEGVILGDAARGKRCDLACIWKDIPTCYFNNIVRVCCKDHYVEFDRNKIE